MVRRGLLVGILLVVVATVAPPVLSATVPHSVDASADTQRPPQANGELMVKVGTDDDRLWPYTSRGPRFDGRTLVLNAIINENPKTVLALFNKRARTDVVSPTPADSRLGATVEIGETEIGYTWQNAHGATRYTYIQAGDSRQWVKQRYQIHVGTYLGTRHHIRAFAPSTEATWTALQAHSEYWDWFRLRHTVTDVRGTAEMLESDFQNRDGATVQRQYTTDSGPLSRGIVVVSSLLLAGLAPRRQLSALDDLLSRPTTRSQTLVVFGIAALVPLLIRVAGVALEVAVPFVTPKLFVVLLYPCLAVGLPLAVVNYSWDLPGWVAAPAAAVGLATAFAVEFTLMGISPPPRIVGHRLLVAVALGLLASAVRGRRPLLVFGGLSLWLWGLLAPLFGYL